MSELEFSLSWIPHRKHEINIECHSRRLLSLFPYQMKLGEVMTIRNKIKSGDQSRAYSVTAFF